MVFIDWHNILNHFLTYKDHENRYQYTLNWFEQQTIVEEDIVSYVGSNRSNEDEDEIPKPLLINIPDIKNFS